jgi:hypothetical protein
MIEFTNIREMRNMGKVIYKLKCEWENQVEKNRRKKERKWRLCNYC